MEGTRRARSYESGPVVLQMQRSDDRGDGYPQAMSVLAETTLTRAERRALDRFASLLAEALGPDLEAVWLYGSRARGEDPYDESDIDVIVLTRQGESDRSRVWRAALESGDAGLKISPITTSRAWVAERRAIASFFIEEVDRDKVVLFGEP